MVTKPPNKRSTTLDEVREHLEHLRLDAIEAEAMALGAQEHLQRIPYIPRSERTAATEAAFRLEQGRMYAYVFATARATRKVLDGVERALDVANRDEGDDNGNGGNGNGGHGRGNDPDLSADNSSDNGPDEDHDNTPLHPAATVSAPLIPSARTQAARTQAARTQAVRAQAVRAQARCRTAHRTSGRSPSRGLTSTGPSHRRSLCSSGSRPAHSAAAVS